MAALHGANGQSFKNYGLSVNFMQAKLAGKVRMNKSQNNKEGASNNHVIETNNMGVFPNYFKNIFQSI